jgi:hypothetical protein
MPGFTSSGIFLDTLPRSSMGHAILGEFSPLLVVIRMHTHQPVMNIFIDSGRIRTTIFAAMFSIILCMESTVRFACR